MSSNKDIINGIAHAFHATNWADRYEEAGGSLSQCQILDVMDPVTEYAFLEAAVVYGRIEAHNKTSLLCHFYHMENDETLEIRSSRFFNDAELFGWYLGMQFLGHGVSWEDDHPPHGLDIPWGEFWEDLTFDQEDL